MTYDTSRIESDVQGAVHMDPGLIAERVRAITVAALTDGGLDAKGLREVMSAVIRGAQQGMVPPDAERVTALKEAVRGLDEALAAAAQATQLAVKEAIGRAGEFSHEGLRHSIDELATLERDFVATLSEAARNTSGLARSTLQDLAEHVRSSGSETGARVRDALSQLAQAGTDLARAQVDGGVRTLRNQAELVASLAAGLLRGMADRLHRTPPGQSGPDQPS